MKGFGDHHVNIYTTLKHCIIDNTQRTASDVVIGRNQSSGWLLSFTRYGMSQYEGWCLVYLKLSFELSLPRDYRWYVIYSCDYACMFHCQFLLPPYHLEHFLCYFSVVIQHLTWLYTRSFELSGVDASPLLAYLRTRSPLCSTDQADVSLYHVACVDKIL